MILLKQTLFKDHMFINKNVMKKLVVLMTTYFYILGRQIIVKEV